MSSNRKKNLILINSKIIVYICWYFPPNESAKYATALNLPVNIILYKKICTKRDDDTQNTEICIFYRARFIRRMLWYGSVGQKIITNTVMASSENHNKPKTVRGATVTQYLYTTRLVASGSRAILLIDNDREVNLQMIGKWFAWKFIGCVLYSSKIIVEEGRGGKQTHKTIILKYE